MPNPDPSRLLTRPNLPYLRVALLTQLTALSIVLALLGYAWTAFDAASTRHDAASRTLQQAQRAERDALAAHAVWQHYHPLYQRLQKARIVAGEDRLRLVEVLEGLKRQGEIRQLGYSVTPQAPVDWPTKEPLGALQLLRSHVQLTFQAPDSAAVLATVAAAQKLPGLAQPLGCGWQDETAGRGDAPLVAQEPSLPLKVRCDLAWLSLAPRAPAPQSPNP